MNTFKRVAMIAAFVVFALTSVGCAHMVQPDPGEQAVLVDQPWFFGHGGVESDPVSTGSTWVAASTSAIHVNIQPQRFDEPFEDIMSSDNVPMSFHAVARLQVTNSVDLISRFGEKWYPNNVARQFQNMIRNKAKNYSMTDLAIQQKSVFDLEKEVQTELATYLKDQRIPVIALEVTVGRVSPPAEVIGAIKQTAEQQQRIKTEAQRKLAEDSRKAAEESRASADKAYQDKMGLTGEQFVRLEQIKMCSAKASCAVFLGSTPVPVVGK